MQAAIESFERATELDPKYGEAYVELAKAKVLLPSYEGYLLLRDSLDEAEGYSPNLRRRLRRSMPGGKSCEH